jgi:hypothetical protein
MSLNHPRAFLVDSGVSVNATNSAQRGATIRKSSLVKQLGAFPVRGKETSALLDGCSAGVRSKGTDVKYSFNTRNMSGCFGPMYVYSNPTALPRGIKMEAGGDLTYT